MFRLALVIVAAITLGPLAAFAADAPPAPLQIGHPIIPTTAQEHIQEGFVQVELAISETGAVTAAKIVESYPKGLYDDAVLKVAPEWKFTPAQKNGAAVATPSFDFNFIFYTDLYENGRNDSIRGGTVRGVSPANYHRFLDVLKQIDKGDLDGAGQNMEELRKRHDDGSMSVTDAARYFAFLTRYQRLRGQYADAILTSRKALMLGQFLDNGKVVDGLHLERLISYASSGQPDAAVDYYDSMKGIVEIDVPTPLVQYVEQARKAGAGKGVKFRIVHYGDLKKNCRTC
jgi:TonB family protein